MLTVHRFDSTGEAYDRSQTGYSAMLQTGEHAHCIVRGIDTHTEVRDGDILYVPSENVVGIMVAAWPYAVTDEAGKFHIPRFSIDWAEFPVPSGGVRDYTDSVLATLALQRLRGKEGSPV